jgi:hypothetical protein
MRIGITSTQVVLNAAGMRSEQLIGAGVSGAGTSARASGVNSGRHFGAPISSTPPGTRQHGALRSRARPNALPGA